VIKPGPLRPAVPGGFTLDDFTLDQDAGTVTCPAGVTRPMSKTRTVTFGAACAGCPLRPRCTTRKDGRSMTIHPHEHLLREARAQARTEEFKRAYPTRSVIERIIAWTAIQNGRRVRLRYFGAAKNDAWLHSRCAAINLRTLLRHGLTRRARGLGAGLTLHDSPRSGTAQASAPSPVHQPVAAGRYLLRSHPEDAPQSGHRPTRPTARSALFSGVLGRRG
jgi:hypothetical protein